MLTTRRNLLKIIGGGTVLAAAGGGAFLATRTPHKALEPWEKAGKYEDYRMNALSYALLAPNPHNRQPWLVDLSVDNTVVIYRDRELNLPETDPFDRQLTIGMGCFLELLKIAASHFGYTTVFELFPEEEDGPVARASFSKVASPDPLFAQVMERRSCKEPFEDRKVPDELAARLASHATIITEASRVSEIIELTWQGWMVEWETTRTRKESVDLMRLGKREINANPDGIDIGGPMMDTLAQIGALSRKSMMVPGSIPYDSSISMYKETLHATPAYAVITSRSNTRIDQIEAGAKWLRLNLATTELGLSLHPISQVLQEYKEMKPYYDKAHTMLAEPGETVQMLGRLGYGPKIARTPRWPLENKLINA